MPDIKAPDSYFSGTSGEDIVKYYLKQWKIACTSLEKSDFGEDILCDIFASSDDGTTNIRTNLTFRTQVKTTSKIEDDGYIRSTKKGFSVSISSALLQLWQKSYYPVIIVIWDLSANQGFWGIPDECIKGSDTTSQKSISVLIKKSNAFHKSGDFIKKYVKDYYNKLLKLDNSKYRCNIYLLWMPQYRLFTSSELVSLTGWRKDGVDVKGHLVDYDPTFISSYNNLNMGGCLYFIEYMQEANSTDEYISNIKNYLLSLPITINDNNWVSFIISPIEVVTTNDYRVVNRITDWNCFTRIGKGLYNDFEFTFTLTDDYYYTEAVRGFSGKQNFFIHKSGRFAVEIFTNGCYSYANKKDDELRNNIYKRSFCVWDISDCTEAEIYQLHEWCINKQYSINFLEEDPSFVVISHSLFYVGDSGVLLPGMSTWEKFDEINFLSKEFTIQIPWGKCPDDNIYNNICKKYFNLGSGSFSEVITSYESTSKAVALRHDERIIRFVCYTQASNKNLTREFRKISSKLKKELKTLFVDVNFVYTHYQDLDDILFELRPFYNISTKDAVVLAEGYFIKLLDSLSPLLVDSKNMAYYIKYLLDRWLPEEYVSR